MAHTYHLRTAQQEVAPQIPLLAPKLPDNPLIIREALVTSLEKQDVDPASIAEIDLNKTERYTMAAFGLNALRTTLVAGEGYESSFPGYRSAVLTLPFGSLWRFRASIHGLQRRGRRRVANFYTNGPDRENQWWPDAADRYAHLGEVASSTPGVGVSIHGRSLPHALSTNALSAGIVRLIELTRTQVEDAQERPKAAHDLSFLATSLAGLHLLQVSRLNQTQFPKVAISKDQRGVYQPLFDAENRGWATQLTRLKPPDVKLKCPLHTDPQQSDMHPPKGAKPLPLVLPVGTNLQTMVHAGINAAADHKLFHDRYFGQWVITNTLEEDLA